MAAGGITLPPSRTFIRNRHQRSSFPPPPPPHSPPPSPPPNPNLKPHETAGCLIYRNPFSMKGEKGEREKRQSALTKGESPSSVHCSLRKVAWLSWPRTASGKHWRGEGYRWWQRYTYIRGQITFGVCGVLMPSLLMCCWLEMWRK